MSAEAERRAGELFEAAQAKSDGGDAAAALSLYLESLALDPRQPSALYNVGLIYKYRRDWRHSLRYNALAVELRPDDEATNWNLGIAATALQEWRIARDAWRRAGMKFAVSDDPIDENCGFTPVRLNGFNEADTAVEVVWASRRSPVTARINNIPTPEAAFHFGDLVLHDGAPNGTRLYAPGDERPVFDVFELLVPSNYITFDCQLIAPDADALAALASACADAQVEFEDWTRNLNMICKACSEGRAHQQHDHRTEDVGWRTERRVGLAWPDSGFVEAILARWRAGARAVRAAISRSRSANPERRPPRCGRTSSSGQGCVLDEGGRSGRLARSADIGDFRVSYLVLKFAHVLTAIVAVGSSVALLLVLALFTDDAAHGAFALRLVRRLMGWIVVPGYVLMLATGMWMGHLENLLDARWTEAAMNLWGFGALFIGLTIVGIGRQIRRREASSPDPAAVRHAALWSRAAAAAWGLTVLVILYFMVFKPA